MSFIDVSSAHLANISDPKLNPNAIVPQSQLANKTSDPNPEAEYQQCMECSKATPIADYREILMEVLSKTWAYEYIAH